MYSKTKCYLQLVQLKTIATKFIIKTITIFIQFGFTFGIACIETTAANTLPAISLYRLRVRETDVQRPLGLRGRRRHHSSAAVSRLTFVSVQRFCYYCISPHETEAFLRTPIDTRNYNPRLALFCISRYLFISDHNFLGHYMYYIAFTGIHLLSRARNMTYTWNRY